ncbi:hypothetical protein F5B22DRAFT_658171 [Xylaria bambusicola]|uniref:uncharacterized protein n=1 Tax=Xylaria bambusicola TaxID=326684 RepID=UPI002008DFA2|nr:uncharacterized protein F5B22DRAFT_658171 [Xylaria bambusicola]KAI0509421.1 hypothetical protein F5B22DRAFT_658171 [Xylaria bambusicola]
MKKIFAMLLQSGEHSDLTLMCKGREFKVHKAIVCTQSPIIDRMIKSKLKEAQTNTIEVKFELHILKCMLNYMYTTDYKVELPSTEENSKQEASAQPAANKRVQVFPTTAEVLLYHAHVNDIAEYYDVTDLAVLSAERIACLLQKPFSAETFCDFIEKTEGLTGDQNLQQKLTAIAASNIVALLEKDFFSTKEIGNNMASGVLQGVTKPFKAYQAKVIKLQGKLRAQDLEISRLTKSSLQLHENLDELVKVSTSTRACVKSSCMVRFGSIIEPPSQNLEGRWMIRCASCGCRYVYSQEKKAGVIAPPPAKA